MIHPSEGEGGGTRGACLVYPWATVSVSKHYKNPTKRVDLEQSSSQ
jgi:hypothetical protein